MNNWLEPRSLTRIGASHARKGVPCQDFSGCQTFLDSEGRRISVLVVSDGHGGSRYVHSDVGSRLACQVAIGEVLSFLKIGCSETSTIETWLAEQLPDRIMMRWYQEIKADWQQNQTTPATPFSPIPYGATLGLVVLTPHWWGHTGLGDWDLVRVDQTGETTLVSEESDGQASGESTFSLCLDGAARIFASRAKIHNLEAASAPFSLLLSTDGIRKSCSTDADYFTLSRYLVDALALPHEAEQRDLVADLDRISSQGSGDDVSVAMARWCPQQQEQNWPSNQQFASTQLYEPPGPRPSASAPSAVLSQSRSTTGSRQRFWRALSLVTAGLILIAIGAVAVMRNRGQDSMSTAVTQLDPKQKVALNQQIQDLCSPNEAQKPNYSVRQTGSVTELSLPLAEQKSHIAPQEGANAPAGRRINATLTNYKNIFSRLIANPNSKLTLIKDALQDPLSALIALSYTPSAKERFSIESYAGQRPPCPELAAELKKRWRDSPQDSKTAAKRPAKPAKASKSTSDPSKSPPIPDSLNQPTEGQR